MEYYQVLLLWTCVLVKILFVTKRNNNINNKHLDTAQVLLLRSFHHLDLHMLISINRRSLIGDYLLLHDTFDSIHSTQLLCYMTSKFTFIVSLFQIYIFFFFVRFFPHRGTLLFICILYYIVR